MPNARNFLKCFLQFIFIGELSFFTGRGGRLFVIAGRQFFPVPHRMNGSVQTNKPLLFNLKIIIFNIEPSGKITKKTRQMTSKSMGVATANVCLFAVTTLLGCCLGAPKSCRSGVNPAGKLF